MSVNAPKRVLIIGNGFDLDLGLHSRFSDFMKSRFWPSSNRNMLYSDIDLISYLSSKKNGGYWFDLENLLSEFANPSATTGLQSPLKGFLDNNKKTFDELRKSLMMYLDDEVEHFDADNDSVAAFFLKHRMDALFSSAYSFNYTDYSTLYSHVCGRKADVIEIPKSFRFSNENSVVHIHGSLANKTAIIGIADGIDTVEGYSFLYKTFSPFYRSCSLWYDLQEAREVVFYGHSLGPQDYHYFQDFFNQCCQAYTRSRAEKRRIIFITKDEFSRVRLLEQIRLMNNNKSDLFYLLNEIHFVYTSQKDITKKKLLSYHSLWYKVIMGREYNGEI